MQLLQLSCKDNIVCWSRYACLDVHLLVFCELPDIDSPVWTQEILRSRCSQSKLLEYAHCLVELVVITLRSEHEFLSASRNVLYLLGVVGQIFFKYEKEVSHVNAMEQHCEIPSMVCFV